MSKQDETKLEKPEYWVCIVGPTVRSKLPQGADFPMRSAVQKTFKQLTGIENEHCWSEWGAGESKKEAILDTWNKDNPEDFTLTTHG